MQANPGDLGGITRDIVADDGPLILDQGIDLSLVSDGDESIIIVGSPDVIRPGNAQTYSVKEAGSDYLGTSVEV